MFERKGLLVIDRASATQEEDDLLMLALEAGAEDFEASEDFYEITTTPETFAEVKDALEAEGCTFSTAEVTRIPQNTVAVTGEAVPRVLEMMEALEEHDDVQSTSANFDIDEAEMEKYSG